MLSKQCSEKIKIKTFLHLLIYSTLLSLTMHPLYFSAMGIWYLNRQQFLPHGAYISVWGGDNKNDKQQYVSSIKY